jgi:hypothetical protein
MHGEYGITAAFSKAETREIRPLHQLVEEDLLTL